MSSFLPGQQEDLQDSILSITYASGQPSVSAVVAPRLSCDSLYVSGDMYLYGSVQTPLNLAAGVSGFEFNNGSASAPTVSFVGDPTSGFYLASTGNIGVSSGGVATAAFGPTGLTSLGGADLVINSSSSNVNFSGKNLINVGSISSNPNWFDSAPMTQVVTTDATPTTLLSIPTATGAAYTLQAEVTAANSTSGTCGSFFASSRAWNVGGTLQISSQYNTITSLDASLASASIAYGTSGTNITLVVTGVVSNTVKWFGVVRVVRSLF
jgi:hypothetical protein